jgi:hypothetical protein
MPDAQHAHILLLFLNLKEMQYTLRLLPKGR